MRLKTFIILAMLCAALPGARAQVAETLRPVTSAYYIEGGDSHLADTYLTPLHYRGDHFGAGYERSQAMRFKPEAWTMQLRFNTDIDITKNPARNATMIDANFHAQWSMMRRWSLGHVCLAVGGNTGIEAGVLYLSRNGNNPASAKAAWTLGLTGFASWSGKVWKVPMTIRYQPVMPLTGVFFSPDYGQLYYQIYIGERSGLVHCAWPGNFFRLDNMLTADLHFGKTSLRVGYHGKIFSSKINNLVTQNFTHALVLGVTIDWISLRPGDSRLQQAKLINSYQ